MTKYTNLGHALEPLAAKAVADEPVLEVVEVCWISAAISLKRIADAIDGRQSTYGLNDLVEAVRERATS